jgi:histidinol phosphatase-like enzyme
MLPKKKILCFDLDDVICTNVLNKNGLIDYKKSKPIKKSIKIINELYKKGYQIDIFTARGMSRYNKDINLINKKLRKLTLSSLEKWKLKFHNLYFGKPFYDFFVDDKCYGFQKNWQDDLKKKIKLKFSK